MNKTSLCEHEHDRATCVGTRKFYRISHTIFRLRNAKLSHTQTLWHIEYRRVLVLHTHHRYRVAPMKASLSGIDGLARDGLRRPGFASRLFGRNSSWLRDCELAASRVL